MKNQRLLIILALVLVLGVASWVVSGKLLQKTEPPEVSIMEVPTAKEATSETSKVVLEETETSSGETFKVVSGKIIAISGQTVVLEAGGDQLQVLVAPDAKITQTTLPSGSGATPQVTEITLDQLQVGQPVDAFVKIEGEQATATNLNVIVGP